VDLKRGRPALRARGEEAAVGCFCEQRATEGRCAGCRFVEASVDTCTWLCSIDVGGFVDCGAERSRGRAARFVVRRSPPMWTKQQQPLSAVDVAATDPDAEKERDRERERESQERHAHSYTSAHTIARGKQAGRPERAQAKNNRGAGAAPARGANGDRGARTRGPGPLSPPAPRRPRPFPVRKQPSQLPPPYFLPLPLPPAAGASTRKVAAHLPQ